MKVNRLTNTWTIQQNTSNERTTYIFRLVVLMFWLMPFFTSGEMTKYGARELVCLVPMYRITLWIYIHLCIALKCVTLKTVRCPKSECTFVKAAHGSLLNDAQMFIFGFGGDVSTFQQMSGNRSENIKLEQKTTKLKKWRENKNNNAKY